MPAQSVTPPPTATQPPPSLEPTPTATTVPKLAATFRDFVRDDVAPALAAGDIAFFEQRAIAEHIVCVPENTPSLPGGPSCQTVGDEFDGFLLGVYRGELFVEPLEESLDWIHRLETEEAVGASDNFGDAMRQVYAIGVPPASWVIEDGHSNLIEDRQYYATALTALIDRPEDFSPSRFPDAIRVVLILNWIPAEEGFRLASIVSADVTGDDLLGFGADTWPLWEPYRP